MVSVSPSLQVDKSTNVRPSRHEQHRWLRATLASLGALSPTLAGRAVEWFFFRPPRGRP